MLQNCAAQSPTTHFFASCPVKKKMKKNYGRRVTSVRYMLLLLLLLITLPFSRDGGMAEESGAPEAAQREIHRARCEIF